MSKRKREIEKRKKQAEEGQTVPEPDRGKQLRRSEPAERKTSAAVSRAESKDTWYSHNRENILLGLLVLYVFLLGLGTVGELFEIEWILNLPLFK